jgi:hypothetical protein
MIGRRTAHASRSSNTARAIGIRGGADGVVVDLVNVDVPIPSRSAAG